MGGISFDDETGAWTCPLCFKIVKQETGDDDDLFDDDEDEEEAFDNDEDYTAEGDTHVQQTPEEKAQINRIATIENAVFKLSGINNKLARYMDKNIYFIVEQTRFREINQDPSFGGKNILPKVLAIAIFYSKILVPDEHIKMLGVNPTTIRYMIKSLKTSQEFAPESEFSDKMKYVGNAVGISSAVIEIMIEQYETVGSPPNQVGDEYTRAAAWIYIKAKQSGIKGITKIKLKNIPGVKKNALDRAVESFNKFLENRNKPVEVVDTIDDDYQV